jgi:hypothetical protein
MNILMIVLKQRIFDKEDKKKSIKILLFKNKLYY